MKKKYIQFISKVMLTSLNYYNFCFEKIMRVTLVIILLQMDIIIKILKLAMISVESIIQKILEGF